MLTISYNGNHIPVDEGFSIKIKWVNPACYFDQIPGDVGLGIDIPVNEFSRTIFGNPERFEKYNNISDRVFKNIDIRFSGVLLLSGSLNITNATNEKYTGWLQSELGVMGEKQRDKFINEMEWAEGKNFENKPTYSLENNDDYATVQIINPRFWEGIGAEVDVNIPYYDEEGKIQTKTERMSLLSNRFRQTKRYKINKRADGNLTEIVGSSVVVSPYLFLRYVIKKSFANNGWQISQNFFDNYPELVVYNNYNIMIQQYVSDILRFYVYENVPWKNIDFANTVPLDITKISIIGWTLSPFDYKYLLPRISFKDFILGLQNTFNVVFRYFNDRKVAILDREAIITGPSFDLDPFFIGEWEKGEQTDVTLKFIVEYDKDDSMFGQDYHDLTERRADFKEGVPDFDSLNEIENKELGELRTVRSENKIYEWKWTVLTGEDPRWMESQTDILRWEFISTGPQPFLYGDSEKFEEIKTCCSTLRMEAAAGELAPGLIVMQKGNLKSQKSLWNAFSFRLMFYHGNGFGATTSVDYTKSLYWEGSNGLFEKRWKNWSRFWKSRLPVDGEFELSLNALAYVIQHITQKFRTRHGEFIIEEMECEFGNHVMGRTKIKGFKI